MRLVRRATAVIDAAEQAPSVDELATALETSVKTLSRAFRQRLGLTTKAFIQARRRERLKTALTEEERVTDAIYAAGYGASSRFYSEAETVLGMTPRQLSREGGRARAQLRHRRLPARPDAGRRHRQGRGDDRLR